MQKKQIKSIIKFELIHLTTTKEIMNIYLQQLVELSKIDAQIDSFEPRLKRHKKELAKQGWSKRL